VNLAVAKLYARRVMPSVRLLPLLHQSDCERSGFGGRALFALALNHLAYVNLPVMYWGTLLLILVGLLGVASASWVVFRFYLSRGARYRRRLKRRNEMDWERQRLRQKRMLEARMREIHGEELRWREAPVPEEASDRSWSRAAEERLPGRDEA